MRPNLPRPPRARRLFLWGALLMFLSLAACGLEVSYTKAELQREIDKHFPLHYSAQQVGAIRLVEPRLELRPSSERLFMTVGVFGRTGAMPEMRVADVGISSAIAYDSDSGQFFAVDPRLEKLSVAGAAKPFEGLIEAAVKEALPKVGRVPLHQLTDGSKERRHLRKVVIRDERVYLTLGL